MATRIEDAA